jgi:hypothetical protein
METAMQNVKTSIKGNILTMEIDLSAPRTDSTTGKTEIVASSHGNQPLPGYKTADGRIVKLGVTAFVPKPRA